MTPRLALLLLSLTGGGVERRTLRMAGEFVCRGLAVDLLVCRPEGELLDAVPAGVRVLPLANTGTLRERLLALRAAGSSWPALLRPVLLAPHASRALRYLPALVAYLERERPAALLAAKTPVNLMALWARRLSRVPTRLVVTEPAVLSAIARPDRPAKRRALPALAARFYPEAEAIVAVSGGVADDLSKLTGIARERIRVIHNGVVTADFAARAAEPAPHPWLVDGGAPVLLAVGRLHADKDYPTLLRAFTLLRARCPARLLILGEGPERAALEALARELGIATDVALPGFCSNPLAAMARATLLVLSSHFEGFPNVLAEALAVGCPVVSTDCPSGPAEILDHGRYGRLTPVGDAEALARAILATLDAPVDRTALERRGMTFSAAAAAARYLPLLLHRPAP